MRDGSLAISRQIAVSHRHKGIRRLVDLPEPPSENVPGLSLSLTAEPAMFTTLSSE
ncbi:MAG: hypothetical protein WBP89_20490 [Sedimenticolaceae bacterium]